MIEKENEKKKKKKTAYTFISKYDSISGSVFHSL